MWFNVRRLIILVCRYEAIQPFIKQVYNEGKKQLTRLLWFQWVTGCDFEGV